MGDVMENLIGLGVSLAYVLAVLGASSLAARRGASSEATRKFVHIALGGWWLIAARFFDSPLWAAALPAAFILVNAFAYRRQKLSFMGRDGGEDTPGTVYYAVSLTALALFSFGIGTPYVGALGFFCMAFGDGFAAVLGKRFGRRVLVGCCGKTLVGSATMLAVSFASCAVVLMAPLPFGAGGILGAPGGAFAPLGSLAASLRAGAVGAAVAAAIEAFSVEGLDNLFVPLGVSALYAVLFLPAAAYTPALAGLLLSGAVALASFRLRLLTVAGGLGAVAVGTLAFAIGGWPLWLLLMWFFGSSNVASKLMARSAARRSGGAPASRKHSGPRTLRQVLANSVPFLACAVAAASGVRRSGGQHGRHVGVGGRRVQPPAAGEHPHARAHAARAFGRREPAGSRGHRGGSRDLGVSGHAAVLCVRLRDSHRARRVLLHHRVRRRGLARGQRAGRGHASEVPLSERR